MTRRRGRPHELTPAIVAEVKQLASEVEYLETLSALLGIDRATLRAWTNRGSRAQRRRERGLKTNESESLFVEFSTAIKKGRAESERRSLETIRLAAEAGHWQAAAWRLERAHPERWSLQAGELRQLRKDLEILKKQRGQSLGDEAE